MPLLAFDHVNLRTAQLEAMVAWYGDILDMHPGDRPNFPFSGAWLYLGDQALVHLIGLDTPPVRGENLTLEFDDHFVIKPTISFGFKADFSKNGDGQTGNPVEQGFSYSSGNNTDWLSDAELMKMVEELDL